MTKRSRREEKIALARQLATPVDVAKLAKEGIIEKRGAWYKVSRIKLTLPIHELDSCSCGFLVHPL